MLGTLQPNTFELAGIDRRWRDHVAVSAAVSRDVAVPRLVAGAQRAGRATPPLIAHLAACVHNNADEVHEEVQRSVPNIALPAYQRMLVAAGHPTAAEGRWTSDLIDAVVAWGDEAAVLARVHDLFDAGADEVLVRPVAAGRHGDETIRRTIDVLAQV